MRGRSSCAPRTCGGLRTPWAASLAGSTSRMCSITCSSAFASASEAVSRETKRDLLRIRRFGGGLGPQLHVQRVADHREDGAQEICRAGGQATLAFEGQRVEIILEPIERDMHHFFSVREVSHTTRYDSLND